MNYLLRLIFLTLGGLIANDCYLKVILKQRSATKEVSVQLDSSYLWSTGKRVTY